jgi:hypothetical protein
MIQRFRFTTFLLEAVEVERVSLRVIRGALGKRGAFGMNTFSLNVEGG